MAPFLRAGQEPVTVRLALIPLAAEVTGNDECEIFQKALTKWTSCEPLASSGLCNDLPLLGDNCLQLRSPPHC